MRPLPVMVKPNRSGPTAEQNWAGSGRTVAPSFEAFLDALTDQAPAWARD